MEKKEEKEGEPPKIPETLKSAIVFKKPGAIKSHPESYMGRPIEDDYALEHIQILRNTGLRINQNVSVMKIRVDELVKNYVTSKSDEKMEAGFICDNMFAHAIKNYKPGKRMLIMIYASGINRCGGMIKGSKAQEEQGCSITDLPYILELFDCQEKMFMTVDRVVLFVKNASFVVDTTGKDIEPIPCDFIFCAAPRLDKNIKKTTHQDEFMQKIIEASFIVTACNGFDSKPYDAVYFGPLGTGCFNWDVKTVAKYFKAYQEKYARALPKITYCIYDKETFESFKSVF